MCKARCSRLSGARPYCAPNRWAQPAAQQIQDRFYNPPQRPFAPTHRMRRRREGPLQQRPFGIGQIAWQSQQRTGILSCARVLSVHIVDFLGSLQNLRISDLGSHQANPLTPLNLISNQALRELRCCKSCLWIYDPIQLSRQNCCSGTARWI